MNREVEPVQGLNVPLVFTTSCGLALYWACFFTMLMRNSFMDGGIQILWYHLFLRVVFLAGGGITCIIVTYAADFLATQRGIGFRRTGVFVFSLVAATSSAAAKSMSEPLPLAFDCFAWGLAGVGLACLLMLWIELLGSFKREPVVLCLTWSVILGACAYLIMNMLPFPFNIGLLCVNPLISMGILTMLERSSCIMAVPFVPRKESRDHARISVLFKAMVVAYGVVLGLGIGLITQIEGAMLLLSGIALTIALGAGAGMFAMKHAAVRIQQNGVFQIVFPALVIALVPMSFLQGTPVTFCNLLLLGCYAFFEMTGICVGLNLAREHHASCIILVASIQACLYAGLLIGHLVGLVAASSGVMDYATLFAVASGLVVVLAIMITIFGLSPLRKRMAQESEVDSEQTGTKAFDGSEAKHEQGRFKTACKEVAHESGLSARETEVFMLLAKGRGIEHIQGKLYISGHTVKSHIYNIYKKIGINSREELIDAVEAKVALGKTVPSEELCEPTPKQP